MNLRLARDWPEAALWLIAAFGCVFAFVGLDASSYWTDELFTLYVVDHNGGWPEIWSRVLTDTWPPAYYVVLYGWTKLFGVSEIAVRSLSAIFAVGAVGVFALGTRGVLSSGGRAFGAAVATVSLYWFEHSQNARAYSLCMLVCAILLSLALSIRRWSHGDRLRFPYWRWLAFTLAGLLGAFLHFYMLLVAGAVTGFLILTVPSWRLRIALAAGGLAILGADVAFMATLLSHTRQNVHDMWFGNSAGFFIHSIKLAIGGLLDDYTWCGLTVLAGLAAVRLVRRSPLFRVGGPDSGWLLALSGFVVAVMIVAGIAASLTVAPSFSDRNLLVASPFAWAAAAALYEAGAPDPRKLWGAALAAVVVLSVGLYIPRTLGRVQPRNDEWRASARYVNSLPACKGQPIPVVQLAEFGPHTPFFREMSERWFFGRYYAGPSSLLHAYLPLTFPGRIPAPDLSALIAARVREPGGCPVLAWGVRDPDPDEAKALADALSRRPEVAPARVAMLAFEYARPSGMRYKPTPSGYVWLVLRSPSETVAPMPRVSVSVYPAAEPIAWPQRRKKRIWP